jgi:hypothetical protein
MKWCVRRNRVDEDQIKEDRSNRSEAAFVAMRCIMTKTGKPMSWVVYRMTTRGKVTGLGAVCEQGEWEAMELAQPGHHTLVQAGITNEGEAERLARSIDAIPIKPVVEKTGIA